MEGVFRQFDVSQLRNVGLFGALTCPLVIKVTTKNELCENHYPPHVFLGAVSKRASFIHCAIYFSLR